MHVILRTSLASAALCVAGAASAAASGVGTVVWDQGPGTGGVNGGYVAESDGQNFADSARFDTDTVIGGINLFSGYDLSGHAGAGAFRVRIFGDGVGQPGSELFAADVGFVGSVNNVVSGVNLYQFTFAPITFSANKTYWVGISGNGFDANQLMLSSPGDGHVAQFQGSSFQYKVDVGDQMFQLTSAVPEPETYALMLAGVGVLGFAARRQAVARRKDSASARRASRASGPGATKGPFGAFFFCLPTIHR